MAIDYELLRSLPVDQGLEYLRRELAGGRDALGPNQGYNPYYADNPLGVVGEGGRLEGSGQLSGYQAVVGSSADPTRAYTALFDPSGQLMNVGQQGADSWYDSEIAGVPLGAFLPLAAAAAGAYFPGSLESAAGEGLLSTSGSDVLMGGTGSDMLTAAPGFDELGTGTFGMNAGYTPELLAAMEGSTLPVLTPGMTAAGYTALPSGAALGAMTPGLAAGAGAAGSMSFIDANLAANAAGTPSLLGEFLSGAKSWAPVIGAAIGAITSGDKQQTQSSSREPWAPAQPWLKQIVADGQAMGDFYKKTPFSEPQKAAYQNLFNDIGNYRQSIAPSLFELANNLGRPYTPQLGNQLPGGGTAPVTGTPSSLDNTDEWRRAMLTSGNRNAWSQPERGMFSMGATSPYGQIDWTKLNPFSGLLGG